MARSKSSGKWLREHFNDEYVQRAKREGYRSRAIYKLIELQEKDHLLERGMVVVDLGAAPGGWSQYAASVVQPTGQVIALDILPMDSLPDVTFLQGDFREEEVLEKLHSVLAGRLVDLVISDMAPNTSGIKAVDQPRGMHLAELAVDFARTALRPGGDLVIKVFQGAGFQELLRELRQSFASVSTRKPTASRPRSPELYLVARNSRL